MTHAESRTDESESETTSTQLSGELRAIAEERRASQQTSQLDHETAREEADKVRALATQIEPPSNRTISTEAYSAAHTAIFDDTLNTQPDAPSTSPAEQQLLTKSVSRVESNTLGGMSGSEIVTFTDGSRAVFKPASREPRQYKEIEPGTAAKRERAAYLVDKAIGLGLVPPTVIATVHGEQGSLQGFIEQSPQTTIGIQEVSDQQLALLSVLDYLAWNSDRKLGDVVATRDAETNTPTLHAFDHGLTFGGPQLKRLLAEDLTDPIGEKLPKATIERIKSLAADPAAHQGLRTELDALLPAREVSAFFDRLMSLSSAISWRGRIATRGRTLEYNGLSSEG